MAQTLGQTSNQPGWLDDVISCLVLSCLVLSCLVINRAAAASIRVPNSTTQIMRMTLSSVFLANIEAWSLTKPMPIGTLGTILVHLILHNKSP